MELKEIQELIRLAGKSNLRLLRIKEGDFELEIQGHSPEQAVVYAANPAAMPIASMSVAPAVAAVASPAAPAEAAAAPAESAVPANTITFRSPMIGTFYRKPSPDKDAFVKVGDVVKNGQVLCIIEAMKLFNEIEFDLGEGRIVKILADDMSPVEYDQPLFLIEKIS
jgi:acetyl-CoA carboxylase biotin carboxyl carrier protein